MNFVHTKYAGGHKWAIFFFSLYQTLERTVIISTVRVCAHDWPIIVLGAMVFLFRFWITRDGARIRHTLMSVNVCISCFFYFSISNAISIGWWTINIWISFRYGNGYFFFIVLWGIHVHSFPSVKNVCLHIDKFQHFMYCSVFFTPMAEPVGLFFFFLSMTCRLSIKTAHK